MRNKPKAIAIASAGQDTLRQFGHFALLCALAYLLFASPAFAQVADGSGGFAGSPMGAVLCNVVGLVLGDIGRGLATLAVIVVGIGAMLGKVSWGMAMTVAVGIAVVFGAPAIVGLLGVSGGGCASGGMIIAGGYGAGGYGNGGAGGTGHMDGNCYNTGANGTKDTMTTISCGAGTATNVIGAVGQLNDLLNGSGSTASGGLLGSFR